MTRDEILKLAEFDESYFSPLRGLCTTETDIMLWNDGGICQVHRLTPLISALAESNEKLVEAIEETLYSDELTVGQSNELLGQAISAHKDLMAALHK